MEAWSDVLFSDSSYSKCPNSEAKQSTPLIRVIPALPGSQNTAQLLPGNAQEAKENYR